MTAVLHLMAAAALMTLASCARGASDPPMRLPDLPDAHGVAGAFAGLDDGQLLVGGGANFPNGAPWDGGQKVWHDRVFALALAERNAQWREAGRLPMPNAYGVSLTTPEGTLIIGGGDAERHFADVWVMRLENRRAVFRRLPPLPQPLAQMTGALVQRTVHIVGGIGEPSAALASAAHWSLDLDDISRGWQPLAPLPAAGRILAAAAALGDALFVFGGCSLAPDSLGNARRTYLRDAWQFVRGQWTRLPDMPRAAAGAAAPAPVHDEAFFVVGGDDGSQVGSPPAQHRGFTREILRYDLAAESWQSAGVLDVPLAVTLPTAPWEDKFVLVSGEVRPGVRTRSVFVLRSQDLR